MAQAIKMNWRELNTQDRFFFFFFFALLHSMSPFQKGSKLKGVCSFPFRADHFSEVRKNLFWHSCLPYKYILGLLYEMLPWFSILHLFQHYLSRTETLKGFVRWSIIVMSWTLPVVRFKSEALTVGTSGRFMMLPNHTIINGSCCNNSFLVWYLSRNHTINFLWAFSLQFCLMMSKNQMKQNTQISIFPNWPIVLFFLLFFLSHFIRSGPYQTFYSDKICRNGRKSNTSSPVMQFALISCFWVFFFFFFSHLSGHSEHRFVTYHNHMHGIER